MKEYKVENWKIGFTKNSERLKATLNEFAKQRWKVIPIAENSATIVFERNKNR